MARYYYHLTNYHHKSRHFKRLRRFIVGFVSLLLIGALGLGGSVYFTSRQKVNSVSQETTVIQQSPVTVLRSEYFQFQAPSGWSEVQSTGASGEYIYRNLANNLISQEITVYVNTVPVDTTAEYILPVRVTKQGLLEPGQVTEHCKNFAPKGVSQTSLAVTYEDVKFNCHVDGTDYTVLVGLRGAGTTMRLPRTNGTTAQYIIRYRDLTANPGPGQAAHIIGSFQTR